MLFIARLTAVLSMLALPLMAHAQENPSATVLVLDASGSMWGQIEGEAKITSARTAVRDLLETMAQDAPLGLIAYGHRREGDCGDIEVLVEPAPGTRDAVVAAVDAISPRGKTPLGDAVRLAAQTLRYQENPATVILLSDGLENCGVDPCALGADLEAAGVDFTAHVIGFDVLAPEDQAQLACIADATGGRFLSAENAAELSEALVAVAAPPEPVARSVDFIATVGEDGPTETGAVAWVIAPVADGMNGAQDVAAEPFTVALLPGEYRVEAVRLSDKASATATVTITPTAPEQVVLALPAPVLEATLSFEGPIAIGATLPVSWTGPEGPGDYIAAAQPDEKGIETYAYIEEGNPAPLSIPAEPGDYEIRYIHGETGGILAAAPVTVTDLSASLDAPSQATVGADVEVVWDGPGQQRDYISVARADAGPAEYVNYTYIADGSPVSLTMPGSPGPYELRYVLAAGPRVLATLPVDVSEAPASVVSAPSVGVGQPLEVTWEGPAGDRDFISIAQEGDAGGAYVNYTYVREGSPLIVTAPSEPGVYEVRYVLDEGSTILASQPITVEDVSAAIDAPPSGAAGGEIELTWQGPAGDRDFVTIATPDADGGTYEAYTYVREGSPLTLAMPSEPGEYELRYILDEGRKILASVPFKVTAVTAELEVPPSATVGDMLSVGWTGPANDRDYVSIARPGQGEGAYQAYSYVSAGNPASLEMPADPGDYEIRYVQATGPVVLARVPLAVQDVSAQLAAPGTAPAGGTVQVIWQGPGYPGDYVSIAEPGANDGRYLSYQYAKEDQTLTLQMPDAPGTYEVRYVLGGGPRVIFSRTINVE